MINQYKQAHDSRKQEVLSFLDKCIPVLRGWGRTETADSLEKLQQNVRDSLFSIVLVGEFSAGKSTFLNALMGKHILPSFTAETTATVNFLRHIDHAPEGAVGKVYYRNGSTELLHDLNRTTIERVVSTRGKHNGGSVAESIDHVDLFLDSTFLKDGVMLVDSPGLNGMAEGHRQMTEHQIKASHACIFMFRGEQPGTRTEFETLSYLKSQSNNIFFVLNKIDQIKHGENDTVEDVIGSIRSSYQKQFPDEKELPQIWPISSYAALVARDHDEKFYKDTPITDDAFRASLEKRSRFSTFEDRLWKYLTLGERTRDQLKSPVEAVVKSMSAERRYWSNQLHILQNADNDQSMAEQRHFLELKIEELKKQDQSSTQSIFNSVNKEVENLKDGLTRRIEKLKEEVQSMLTDCTTVSELQDTLARFNDTLELRISKIAKATDTSLRQKLLNIAEEEYNQYIDDFAKQFGNVSVEVFQFEFEPFALPDGTIGVDLNALHEKTRLLKAQIEELEQERNKTDLKCFRAQEVEDQIERLRNDIRFCEENRRFLADNLVVPDVRYHNEEEVYEYNRPGALGWVGNFLFGKKRGVRTVTKSDSSARDEVINRYQQNDQQWADRIAEGNRQLNEIHKPDESSRELEFKRNQLQALINKTLDQLNDVQEQGIQNIEHKSARALRRSRHDTLVQLDNMFDTLYHSLQNYLENQKRQYRNAVRELLSLRCNQELTNTKAELDELIALQETQGQQRQQKLDEATAALKVAESLAEEGADLAAKLDAVMTDSVDSEYDAAEEKQEVGV